MVRKYWVHLIILFIIPIALYWGGVHFNYILDDKIVLSENSFVKEGLDGIKKIFTTDSFQGYFGESTNFVEGGRYRPLSLVTFAIEYQFLGLNPTVSHVVNILLYSFTGLLVFILSQLLITRIFPQSDVSFSKYLPFAFVVALLFICHPVHTEAVANIKGRDEVLALLLGLGSIVSAIYAFKNQKINYFWAVGSALLLFLACMSKENALTLLAIIPLSIWLINKKSTKNIILSAGTSLIAIASYLFIRHQVLGYTVSDIEITNPMNNSFYGMNSMEYWSTIFYTLTRYVELLVFPHPLSHDYYPYAVPNADLTYIRTWVGFIMYAGMAIYALYSLIKKPSLVTYGIIFYLATLSIVSNVFFSIGTFMNERFIYFPSVGYALVLAVGISYLWRKVNKILAYVLLAIIILGYSYKTITRVPVWENNVTLNRSAVKASPNSARANLFMGTALYKEAQTLSNVDEQRAMLHESATYIDNAINIWPRMGNSTTKYFAYSEALRMKAGVAGNLHTLKGLTTDQLLEIFKFVLSKKPDLQYVKDYMDYLNKTEGTSKLIKWYHHVGYRQIPQFARQIDPRKYDDAISFLKKALVIDQNNATTLFYLSEIYKAKGNGQMSAEYLSRARAINPNIGR